LLQRSLVAPVHPKPNGKPGDGAQPAPQAAAPSPLQGQPALVDGSTQAPSATPAAAASPQAGPPRADAQPRAQSVAAARELNPPGLQIGAAELSFIEGLAPLMDRSPRALKRFVNVYRLIKVGMERDGFAAPAQAEHISTHQTAVLFLLAVSTGSPALAARLVAELRTWHAGRGGPEAEVRDVAWLVGRLEPAATAADRFALARIRSWLQPANAAPPLSADLDTLAEWAPVVSRYSFKLGPRWG
jgi:hypothetical protein